MPKIVLGHNSKKIFPNISKILTKVVPFELLCYVYTSDAIKQKHMIMISNNQLILHFLMKYFFAVKSCRVIGNFW
jgi:hypothetical protein